VLPTKLKVLSNIRLSSLTLYVDEIIEDRHCGLWRNRSTADHILCMLRYFRKVANIVGEHNYYL